jgi:hypothetical protein
VAEAGSIKVLEGNRTGGQYSNLIPTAHDLPTCNAKHAMARRLCSPIEGVSPIGAAVPTAETDVEAVDVSQDL